MDSFPHFVRMNRDEISRFEQYLASQNISIPMILRQLVEAREAAFEPDDDDQFATNSQGTPKENPWTDAVLCTTCIDALVRVQSGVWNWWLQERARGPLDRMSIQSRVFRRLILAQLSYCQSTSRLLVWVGMPNASQIVSSAYSCIEIQCQSSLHPNACD